MSSVIPFSLFTDFDIDLFKAGKHFKLYEKLGAHPVEVDGKKGVYFAVWAPSAKKVLVIGDFNFWVDGKHPLNVRWDSSGIWEGFIPDVKPGTIYKYKIHSNIGNITTEKADPFARFCEVPPRTGSIVWEDNYTWKDKNWMQKRKDKNALEAPFSVYEVHLGSWRKNLEENRSLTYEELADQLVKYVQEMGFTHVELMPVMEHPFDPSWGYQVTGFFAPTSRFGKPDEFKFLVDKLHRAGIGVILDWVPSHFPDDPHGLGQFDGSHLYEHPDRRKGYHPDWKSLIFNYGRNEVKAFLISNALFWLEQYHADGLRVDAVASMLYLDYSRKDGEWEPNKFGGREHLEAIDFIKELNLSVYKFFPDVQMIAEESTSFTKVSRPVFDNGLGFGMKWMMGWMHDTLEFFKKDMIHRKYHLNEISFSMTYAFTENFMLPLSHDEVVHGKKSLLYRMPGDEWQRFANLRLMFSYMFTHPGSKLLFMGAEFGQGNEWNFDTGIEWHLLDYPVHQGMQTCVADLNKLYKNSSALYEKQFSPEGFEWISFDDSENSVISFIRKGEKAGDILVVVCNFTPVIRKDYRIGLPIKGKLKEVFNSDDEKYGGSGVQNAEMIKIEAAPWNGRAYSAAITIPPLAGLVFTIKKK